MISSLSADRLSPGGPGSPLLGSCGPGREITASGTNGTNRKHGFRPTPNYLAVILDSAQPGPRVQGQARGSPGLAQRYASGALGAPARWQEITVSNPPGPYQPIFTPIANPALTISLSESPVPSSFRQSVRANSAIDFVFRTSTAHTDLAEAGVRRDLAIYGPRAIRSAHTLGKKSSSRFLPGIPDVLMMGSRRG